METKCLHDHLMNEIRAGVCLRPGSQSDRAENVELNIAQKLRIITTKHLKGPKPKRNQEVLEAERKLKKRFCLSFINIK